MSTSALKRLSLDEYIAHERQATEKSQFFDGELFAMAGGSHNHSLIGSNLVGESRNVLKPRDCQVHGSDMRVVCPSGLGTYPDCLIVCGPPEFADTQNDTLTNPTIIFEVLSPSTESFDRGGKFGHYQSLPSLREYVLVSQDRMRIEHFVRQPQADQWLLTVIEGIDADLVLPTIEIRLSLAEIYAKVSFEESERTPGPTVVDRSSA